MGLRQKKLKKVGGDLEAQKQSVSSLKTIIGKQNVTASEVGLGEQNVAPSKSRIDESSNLCGLKLAMVTIYTSNDEILPHIDWEFRSRSGGLDCLKIYIY
jgi:hypothetical protein